MISTSSAQASASFTPFARLPTELRLKIWELNLPAPRLVPLHYTPPSAGTNASLQGSTSPAPIPQNLHTCQESRYLALCHYRLSFALMQTPPKIFFSPCDDILYFGYRAGYQASFKHFVNAIGLIEKHELGQVRRLAVHEGLFLDVGNGGRNNPTITAIRLQEFWNDVRLKFAGMEEVIVVVNQANTFPDTRVHGPRASGERSNWQDQVKNSSGDAVEENLSWKIARAVEKVEQEYGWKAPRWTVMLLCEDLGSKGFVENVTIRDAEKFGAVEESIITRDDGRYEKALL
jgi:hypothetical protein